MNNLVSDVAQRMVSNQEMLAVAESCTGGWLAKVCTDMAGSSTWFERGFVTYSNKAKHEMLGVSLESINTYGAVSQYTVEAMAAGVLSHSHADWAIAISGVAGPDGGSDVNPVGSVWFAWMKKNQQAVTSKQLFSGDRNQVRQQSVEFALEQLFKLLK